MGERGESKLSRQPTIYDVARASGVSHQTVSRWLKDGTGVRAGNREKIDRAVQELGYRPNWAAKNLASSRSTRIGALVDSIADTGPNRIIQGATAAARRAGYMLDVVTLGGSTDPDVGAAVDVLGSHDLAGVLAFSPSDRVMDLLTAAEFGVPVHISREVAEPAPPGRVTANRKAMDMAVRHLHSLGHRDILHLKGPGDWVSARNRSWAFRDTSTKLGVRPTEFVAGDWSAAAGFRVGDDVVRAMRGGVTAVIAENDLIGLGLLKALHAHGVSVPKDVSIVGIDGIPEGEYMIPALTSVELPFEQYGREAIARLIAVIEAVEDVAIPTPSDPVLRVRESTAARIGA